MAETAGRNLYEVMTVEATQDNGTFFDLDWSVLEKFRREIIIVEKFHLVVYLTISDTISFSLMFNRYAALKKISWTFFKTI